MSVENLQLPQPRDGLVIVLLADVECPISRRVNLRLTVSVSEPRKAIARILDVPVVVADLHQRLYVVHCRARPESSDGTIRAKRLVP